MKDSKQQLQEDENKAHIRQTCKYKYYSTSTQISW